MENYFDTEVAEDYDRGDIGPEADERLRPMITRLETLAQGGPVLEFAIGTGRVGLRLANRGLAVSGIEYSQAMIDVLKRKPGAQNIPVIQGDMASATVTGDFPLVILVYNTICNLLTQDAQIACFQNAARHLRPGGRFVIELFVPPLRQFPPGASGVTFDISKAHTGLDTINTATQQLVSHHYTQRADGSIRYSQPPARYIWPAELDLMARIAGFELENRWADWNGGAFNDDSTAHVSVYRLNPQG